MDIAIDIGGTKIACALIENDQIIDAVKVDSIIHTNIDDLAPYVYAQIKHWVAQARSVNIACTGQVSPDAVNFLSVRRKLPLQAQLRSLTGLPVTIINDASAAAWAEYVLNDHVSRKNFIYITVSTGVGAGIVFNDEIITCADGFCAHLGHTAVNIPTAQSYPCHCGRENCVEAIASGTAIAKYASQALGKTLSAKDVFTHYAEHPDIMPIIDNAATAVAELIFNMKATFGNDTVIIGGSVGLAPLFINKVAAKVQQAPEIYQVTLLAPKSGANADVIGVHHYAKKQLIES
ncbi:ROK family protein [Pseudoalteromonas sp.]|uniref:ROK family protein n=1 Tax=Pseudoalteromonas sp. TaxID=53249 RepID=UPI003562EAAF